MTEQIVVRTRDIDSEIFDADLRSYMLKVYNYMTAGIGISGIVAYLITTIPELQAIFIGTPLFWVCFAAPLVMIFFFSDKLYNGTPRAAQMWFWTFCALEGVGLTAVALHYAAQSIVQVFFLTTAMFAGLSIWGYTTKKELSGFASFFFMALIGLIIAMIFNIFIVSEGFGLLISCAAVLIFAGLIAFDTQMIKNQYIEQGEVGNSAVVGALHLYLDFLNMFLHLLYILGISNND